MSEVKAPDSLCYVVLALQAVRVVRYNYTVLQWRKIRVYLFEKDEIGFITEAHLDLCTSYKHQALNISQTLCLLSRCHCPEAYPLRPLSKSWVMCDVTWEMVLTSLELLVAQHMAFPRLHMRHS